MHLIMMPFFVTFTETPDKPSKPDIVDYDKDMVELEWRPPLSDGGSPITGYIVEKKEKYG